MTTSLGRALKQKWKEHSRRPFFLLTRLFLDRVFHGNGESEGGELDFSLGLVLTILALPGGFYSLLLLDKYASLLHWFRGQQDFDPLAAALPDEYFFIVLSMVVTGAVAVWRWDSIFPDRRDYANLVPLPISTQTIFSANLAAILFLTGVLALDVNAASGLLFPLVVSESQDTFSYFAQFAAIHISMVILASVFSFLAVLAVIGLLMVLLPYGMFRRISLYVRSAMMLGFVALLWTGSAVTAKFESLPNTGIRFLPPVWFLGFCQMIRGRASPGLADAGRTAPRMLGLVFLVAIAAYALSYRRCFKRIPEVADVVPTRSGAGSSWLFSLLDQTILKTPVHRAGCRFIMKTLARSDHHSLILGGFFGFGIVLASQTLFATLHDPAASHAFLPSADVLSIPLILSYCIVVGLRFVFEIPAELRANWVFKLSIDEVAHGCASLASKVIMLFVAPWIIGIVLPLYCYLWNWRVGVLEAVVTLVWSFLLAEILLLHFRKLPFTCSYPPFRDSAIVLLLTYVMGYFIFVVLTSRLEYWALINPVWMIVFTLIAASAWLLISHLRQEILEVDRRLIFEDQATVSFELLDLGRGS